MNFIFLNIVMENLLPYNFVNLILLHLHEVYKILKINLLESKIPKIN